MVNKKGNKRKRNKTNTETSSKVPRTNNPPSTSTSTSTVKMLAEARGSLENKSFSGLDFSSIEKLFKGNDVASVANILYDNSSPIDFGFELPELQTANNQNQISHEKQSHETITLAQKMIETNTETTICTMKDYQKETSSKLSDDLPLLPETNLRETSEKFELPADQLKNEQYLIHRKEQSFTISTSTTQVTTADTLIKPAVNSTSKLFCALDKCEDETYDNVRKSCEENLLGECYDNTTSLSSSLETNLGKRDSSNIIRTLSPTSGYWRNYTENENDLQYSVSLPTFENLLLNESTTSNDETLYDIYAEKESQSNSSPVYHSDSNKYNLQTERVLLSPSTGLLSNLSENNNYIPKSRNHLSHSLIESNEDKDLTDCELSPKSNDIIKENYADITSSRNYKLLSPTTGLWRNSRVSISSLNDAGPSTSPLRSLPASPSLLDHENFISELDDINSLDDAGPSTSQLRSLPASPSLLDHENFISELDDINSLDDAGPSTSQLRSLPASPSLLDHENFISELDDINSLDDAGPSTSQLRSLPASPSLLDHENFISELDDINSLDDAGPSTSQLRLLPASPSLLDLENTSELDDSVEDPNYEEENEQYNSRTDSDTQEENQDNNSVNNSSTVDTDSDQTSSSENRTEKTRKKKANPSAWKRNVTKLLRNSGNKYTTLKKGTPVPKKTMGPPCNESCRLKCSRKLSEEERKSYFNRYWSLNDINKQRQYISNMMAKIKPKYRYPKDSNRKFNHAFYFLKEDIKIKVCKKFFTSTLGVTNRCIRTVIHKTNQGLVEEDRRGKHKKHEIPEEVKNYARNHISSIPVVESHYRRADSVRNYIEGGRNLTDLYKDYKKVCIEKNIQCVSFAFYRNMFYYEFNLAFFKPKKDMCQFCESYKNMNETEKAEKQEEYKRHHEEKDLSRLEKAEDKKKISNNFRVACYDLEAALPTPRGEISTFYYRSKLSTYNFTICDLNTKGLGTVHCYVWHEGEGHKGSNEIGSSLLHYLERYASSQEAGESTQNSEMVEFTFYSDNCGGQGKNKFIIAAYLYAVANYNIKSITHKFLVVGHTQNEGDVAHSVIERTSKSH